MPGLHRSTLALLGLSTLAAVACGAPPGGAPEETATTSEAVTTICGQPSNGPVQGVDVSVYQGNFDWGAAKAGGTVFGYARISDGTGTIDSTFDGNWANMKSAGVLRGAYQFFEPGEDETAQANLMVQKVGQLGAGDLPAMIDVEVTGGQTGATILAKVQHWLQIVQAGTGKAPIIYTGSYFWEGNVGAALNGTMLWTADYGPSCPLVPNGWSGWAFWQYGDGGGSLDHDVFNGSLAQLQALAGGAAPRGYLDQAACDAVSGWAQDPSVPTQSINVDLYFDAPAGQAGSGSLRLNANVHRPDLCTAIGSCDHGFSLLPPVGLEDGKPHGVYAYGIAASGTGPNPLLTDAPKSFTCPAPAIPLSIAAGIKRWVSSPAIFTAWKFDYLLQVAQESPSEVASYVQGANVPDQPTVVLADDGSPAVWVIDGNVRRHVVNPDSLSAWQFSVAKMPAAQVNAFAQGPDWPLVPFLFVAAGQPAVYMLDVAIPVSSQDAGAGEGGVVLGGEAGPAPADDAAAPSPPPAPGAQPDSSSSSGGCAVRRNAGHEGQAGWLVFAGLGLVALSRRRRARGTRSGAS